jgi:uncharacterized protein YoxC
MIPLMRKKATLDQVLDAVVGLSTATGDMDTRLTQRIDGLQAEVGGLSSRIDNVELNLTRRIDNFEMNLTHRFDQMDARLISVEASAR